MTFGIKNLNMPTGMMFNEIIKIDKCKKLKFIFFLYRVVAWF